MNDYDAGIVPFGLAVVAFGLALVLMRRRFARLSKGTMSVRAFREKSESFWIRYSLTVGIAFMVLGGLIIGVGGFLFADS